MIENYTIYGERCSGTNFLVRLMEQNFDNYKVTWDYGNKHFFGFHEDKLKESDNTLFTVSYTHLTLPTTMWV